MKVAIVPVTAYQQNCSILLCEETNKIAVVDPGGDIPFINEQIEQMGGTPEKVFLTHGHLDHCSQAREFADSWGIPLEGPHKEDKFWLDQLPEYCEMSGFPAVAAFEPDRWLEQGDSVQFGNVTLEVFHTPGHTPGHVVFFHRDMKLALVGDVLFMGSIGRTDFPKGDHDTLISSIKERLFPLGRDITFISGHGPVSNFGHEMDTNPFVSGQYA